MKILKLLVLIVHLALVTSVTAQDYFLEKYEPYNQQIPTPEAFLGYPIGSQHTRHDLIVAYFNKLAELSDRASITVYGKTHENRHLVMLTITLPEHLNNLSSLKEQHLAYTNPSVTPTSASALPIFIQLGYNVHGNEPSSAEAAMLTAYTLVASNNNAILSYLQNAVVFIDPTINPDGRDRHTQWANQFKANPLVSDPLDAEHNEGWPRGRTNHYWFDLNRDWLLAINPESRGKLKWYHEWYPNVVTDFHEMGTNSHYFFEPMKPIGSKEPLMPKENYEDLNSIFANYFVEDLDSIGALYFTKEAFDGTYPGYGSSYPDLQGALALLFEQASSRGHLQDTHYGTISFPFTIRNQYVSSLATVRAAVDNKERLRAYQHKFFKTAISQKPTSGAVAYKFSITSDFNRAKAFLDKLLLHKIKVYNLGDDFFVPLQQEQRRMVQTVFETYKTYRDSVFYDASAWSLANFYNIAYTPQKSYSDNVLITTTENILNYPKVTKANYAYILDWTDYNAHAVVNYLQNHKVKVASALKPFSINTNRGVKSFGYGSILIPVSMQSIEPTKLFDIINSAQQKFNAPLYAVNTGFSNTGIDLGSRNFGVLKQPKAALLIGNGVNSYEAGEVWHLLDTRVHMPITKMQIHTFKRASLDKYNVLVMVSGSYADLNQPEIDKIKDWVAKGNTLITIAGACNWAIKNKLVSEKINDKEKDTLTKRLPYVEAPEHLGRERLGGAIVQVDLDISHPVGFGYTSKLLPVYKNNTVFIAPSKNSYATVAQYTKSPHIDGFISAKNIDQLKKSASIIVSKVGSGKVVLFADNPNFRGSWYGTNKLFLNAMFLGNLIRVP